MITLSYAELFWFLLTYFMIGLRVREFAYNMERAKKVDLWGMIFMLYTLASVPLLKWVVVNVL